MVWWSKVIDYVEYLCWAVFVFTLTLVKLGYVSFEDLSINYEELEDFNRKRAVWAVTDDTMFIIIFFMGMLLSYYMRQNQRENEHERLLEGHMRSVKNLNVNKLDKALVKIKTKVPKMNEKTGETLGGVNQKNMELNPWEIERNKSLAQRESLEVPKSNPEEVKLQTSESVLNASECHSAITQLEKNIATDSETSNCNQTKPMCDSEQEVDKLVVTPTKTSALRKYASRKMASPAKK